MQINLLFATKFVIEWMLIGSLTLLISTNTALVSVRLQILHLEFFFHLLAFGIYCIQKIRIRTKLTPLARIINRTHKTRRRYEANLTSLELVQCATKLINQNLIRRKLYTMEIIIRWFIKQNFSTSRNALLQNITIVRQQPFIYCWLINSIDLSRITGF